VVNNTMKESINITTVLKGAHKVWVVGFGPKETEQIPAKWGDTTFRVSEEATSMNTWLAPGQMELYRVE
jgi:hypothetical protein